MKNFWKNRKKEILIALFILSFAAFLRIYKLTYLPIFADEAIYIRWSQVMRAEPGLRFLPLSDGKQPLFMWVTIPFLKLIADPLFAARIVSALAGLGTLVGIFMLSYLLFKSRRAALFASFIYAISPFSVFFDKMALVDSMLSFFGVWTLVFSVITVKKVRLDAAMLSGFFLGGAILTKSPGIFFAILLPLTLTLHKWPKKWKEKFNSLSVFVFLFAFTYLIAFAMHSIQRLGPNFHMIAIRNKDYVYPLSHILESPLNPLVPFLKDIFGYFWLLGPAVLIIMFLVGVYYGLKEKRKEALLLLAWAIFPLLVVAEYSTTMTARYIYFTLPYLFIIVAYTFKDSLPAQAGRTMQLARKFLIILFVGQALFIDFQLLTDIEKVTLPRSERSGYLEEWTAGYGIKESADLIREEFVKDPDKKIVVGTEGYFGTLPDGLQIYLNDLSAITVIGVGLDLTEIPKSLSESKKSGNKTYLVINDSRLRADSDALGLKVVAAYPKAFRKEGTREYNTLGPRETLYLFEVVGKSVEKRDI